MWRDIVKANHRAQKTTGETCSLDSPVVFCALWGKDFDLRRSLLQKFISVNVELRVRSRAQLK